MDDQQIAEQILEAEGVIRDLAGHMQRAMEVADGAADAKQSYETSAVALEKAIKEVITSKVTLQEATGRAKAELAGIRNELVNVSTSLDGAGAAVTSSANDWTRKIE